MTDETKIQFDEPKTFTLSKFKLGVSLIMILWVFGIMIFGNESYPGLCYSLAALFALYLFLPFTYKLVVSDVAISSINLLGTRTLEWNDVAEIRIVNGNLILNNRDGDIKVTINQQIDSYPEVIKFIKQQRPDIWRLDDIKVFRQSYSESVFSVLMGIGTVLVGVWALSKNDLTTDMAIPMLFILGVSGFLVFHGLMRIRKLTLDGETLVLQYLVWKRQIHVKDVWSVSLEQQFGRNVVTYSVHIRIRDGRDVVIEKVKEGNPILVNAIEMWMKKHKGKPND